MNILKLSFLVLIHVSAGFKSLDALETFYKLRPSYDPYGTVSSKFYVMLKPCVFKPYKCARLIYCYLR